MAGYWDEDGGPSEDLVMDWEEHNAHADDHPDDERDEMDEAVAAVYAQVAAELTACEVAATRVRQTATSGNDYEQARAGFELAVRFDALHAKLRQVTGQPDGEVG